eukprot:3357647-Pyramimonas_sp.AAC.1
MAMMQVQRGGATYIPLHEELLVLGVAPRPSALDVCHAKLAQLPRDGQLVIDCERNAHLWERGCIVMQAHDIPDDTYRTIHLSSGNARSCAIRRVGGGLWWQNSLASLPCCPVQSLQDAGWIRDP